MRNSMEWFVKSKFIRYVNIAGLVLGIVWIITEPSVTSALLILGWASAAWTHYHLWNYHQWVLDTFQFDPFDVKYVPEKDNDG